MLLLIDIRLFLQKLVRKFIFSGLRVVEVTKNPSYKFLGGLRNFRGDAIEVRIFLHNQIVKYNVVKYNITLDKYLHKIFEQEPKNVQNKTDIKSRRSIEWNKNVQKSFLWVSTYQLKKCNSNQADSTDMACNK